LTNLPLFFYGYAAFFKEKRGYSKKSQKEGTMGKRILFFMILPVLVLALAGVSYGWQGRMGGMGDPYGLVQDESDYLTHPAKIAKGEGVRFYGDYRFLYTGVTDWDVELEGGAVSSDFSGNELRHNALLGAAFPLGPGRMGLFFTYEGRRGDFDAEEIIGGPPGPDVFELTDDLDNFALRLLYGLPLGSFKLGAEVGFAHRQDKKELFAYATDMSGGIVNLHMFELYLFNLFIPAFVPYDSAYWEIPMRLGAEGKVGPLDLEFTLRGGVIVSGDNTLRQNVQVPVGNVVNSFDMDGDVGGWRIGGDLWLRYPLTDTLTLPVLVRADYWEKTRDGDGSFLSDPAVLLDYKHKETGLDLAIGGGLDKELAKGTRIAGGIYYNYLHGTEDVSTNIFDTGVFAVGLDFSDLPTLTEHRVMVRLAGEHEFSPLFALRMGLEGFYGWATQDVTFSVLTPPDTATFDVSSHGSHWGIGVSLGGSIRFKPLTLEPFVNAGYQSLDLSGDVGAFDNGALVETFDRDDMRNQWYVGGGLSVLFDMP
jgi:hypothetical protein